MNDTTIALLIIPTFLFIVVLISLAFVNEEWTDMKKGLFYVFFFLAIIANQYMHKII